MSRRKFKNKHKTSMLLTYLFMVMACILTFVLLTQDNNTENNYQQRRVRASNKNTNVALSGTEISIPDARIPILMYHHIRNYNNNSDKTGTNLSVEVDSFRRQLDQIKDAGYTTINFNTISSGKIPDKSIVLSFDDGYDNFYQNAYPELKKRGMTAVVFVISDTIGRSGYLTESQINLLANNNIEIGSHTLSHPALTKLNGDKLRSEILESKNRLTNITNHSIISFCYPTGKHNAETETIVEESGYIFATTTKSGLADLHDQYTLKRYRINKDSSVKYILK